MFHPKMAKKNIYKLYHERISIRFHQLDLIQKQTSGGLLKNCAIFQKSLTQVFSVNFAKFLRTSSYTEHLQLLLLLNLSEVARATLRILSNTNTCKLFSHISFTIDDWQSPKYISDNNYNLWISFHITNSFMITNPII